MWKTLVYALPTLAFRTATGGAPLITVFCRRRVVVIDFGGLVGVRMVGFDRTFVLAKLETHLPCVQSRLRVE